MENLKIKYSYWILFIFVVLEVLLYNSNPTLQLIVSIVEYLFVVVAFIMNKRIGIMYFVSFSLLAFGGWSYVIQETLPNNFWGLRAMNFSLNILFSIGLAVYCFIFHSEKIYLKNITKNGRLLSAILIYALVMGFVSFVRRINYPDNFFKDVLTYLPFFVYLILLALLENEDILKIFKYGVSLTVISMLISFVTRQTFEYAPEYSFLLMNGFAFIVTFSIFFLRKYFTANHYYFLLFTLLALFLTGKVFISAKLFIIAVISILWFVLHNRKSLRLIIPVVLILVFAVNPILIYLTSGFDESLVVTHKITQIFNFFELMDLDSIASTKSSMGNIIAEAITLFYYLLKNQFYLLFGKGFGGGVPDLFGYLSLMALPGSGYDPINAVRNDFFRFHLPIYEIIIKSGLIGFIIYSKILINAFKAKGTFNLIFFVLLFTVFTNSKEMILLTMLLLRLVEMQIDNEKENYRLLIQ